MKKPTREDIETTLATIEYLFTSTLQHEPHATNFLAACETLVDEIPRNPKDIDDVIVRTDHE